MVALYRPGRHGFNQELDGDSKPRALTPGTRRQYGCPVITVFTGSARHGTALSISTLFTLIGSLAACAAAAPEPAPSPAREPVAAVENSTDAPAAAADDRRGRTPASVNGDRSGGPGGLLPLLRPGRRLHFRGRSHLDASRPDDRLRPAVGHVFSTLWLSSTEADGRLLLAREMFPYSAGSRTSSVLSAPRERRRETLRLDPTTFTLERLEATSEPYRGKDRWGAAGPLRFTSDGFGLNTAARLTAAMHSVAIPRELYLALTEEGEITHDYDFYLVVADPLGDRVVALTRPGAPPPDGAERHIVGRTVFRVEGRETFRLDRRFAPPPLPDDQHSPPLAGRPDERILLPSLRVRVSADLIIEPAGDRAGARIERRDRLTWTVLDHVDEPWLLAWEGLIRTESGNPLDPDIREASVSRELVRIEDTGSQP